MLKNMKKVFFAVIAVFAVLFMFACNKTTDVKEANAENCKEFCPAESGTCNEASAETCKEFCKDGGNCEKCPDCDKCPTCPELNKENCADYCETCPPAPTCDFVKPTSFIIYDDDVIVGSTSKNELDEISPRNAYQGVIWSSSDESILTVDQDGVMFGVRPGFADVTATSVLNPEASYTVTIRVIDNREPADIVSRETELILSQLPAFATADFEWPQPWNLSDELEVKFTDSGDNTAEKFVFPTNLEDDLLVSYNLIVKFGSMEKSTTFKIWAVKDANDNCYVRVEEALAGASALLKAYSSKAEKVAEDLVLPPVIYGVTMNWDTSNPYVLGSDGKYYRPLEDKTVNLSGTERYKEASKNFNFEVVAKGYDKAETIAYILEEGSLANLNGGEFNTSLVFPQFDDKFGAKLTFTSKDTSVWDNDGKLVAAPAEAKDVEFEVEIDNTASNNNSFKETVTITVKALPENEASKVAEAWLKDSEFASIAHTPYGTEKGNVLDLPVAGDGFTVSWDVSGARADTNRWYAEKDAEGNAIMSLPAFLLNAEGKPRLIAQPLRYKEVQIQGTFTKGEDTATVNLVLNIGISEFGDIIRTGVWRSSDQGDTTLSVERGAWDLYDNASHFDDSRGYTKSHYGSGLWSGVIIRNAEEYEGKLYETVFSDLMYFEAVDDAETGGVKANVLNLTGGNGGNWGWLMYNNTDKDIKVEVGVYSDSTYNQYAPVTVTDDNYESFGLVKEEGKYYQVTTETNAEGQEVEVKTEVTEYAAPLTAAIGSRLNLAIDGYALGFVTDAEGNVLYGSGDGKFEQSIPDQRVKVGTDNLLIADSAKGASVNYVVVPAHGYAASWKYQFYGVGVASTLYPLCQVGSKLDIKRYDVHPLQEGFAQSALNALVAAEKAAGEGKIDRTNINSARANYEKLSGATKEDVFEVARLELLEALLAFDFDQQITELLAKDPLEGFSTDPEFVETLAKYYTQHMNNSAEIQAATTKAADLIACYEKYAALDLTITYDFDGGFAQGYYSYKDKELILPLLLSDLYDFLIEQNAWGDATPVAKDVFMDKSSSFWIDHASLSPTDNVLVEHLFTPHTDADGNVHEDYMSVIEGTDRFFNDARYNKWIAIMDFVNEATQAGNMGGQDAWGRLGLLYNQYKYANVYNTSLTDLTKYNGNEVHVITKGTGLGAFRFCQWVNDSIAAANHRGLMPHNVYATVFDRQQTQERYSKQIYHCTDATVKLQDAPYKAGYEFAGWFFVNEDGSLGDAAEIVGSMFKDVTVKAKWVPGLLAAVGKLVGKELTPSYYPIDKNGGKYMSAADNADATLSDQDAQVGIGQYAFVVGDKFFPLPKYALIELGKDADEGKTYSTKEELEVYGVDEAQNSTGIVLVDGVPTKQNSYGHGALYMNAGTKDIVISDISQAYGRSTAPGTAYGYHKYQFHFDTEKKVYVGTLRGVEGSVTLAPGDFLWCPMTAERFVTGLTDCDGTSGKVGVLADGIEVQIIDITGFLPAESPEWHSVLFYDGDELVYQFYPEAGTTIEKPADLEKLGFNFLGWNTDKDATTGADVVLTPEEDATYYAIWEECARFDEVVVTATPAAANEYTTIAEALNHVNDNAVIKLTAGTYSERLVIETPVTIEGPNADLRGYWNTGYYNGNASADVNRKAEALFDGTITIKVDNVTLKGIHFGGDNSIYEGDAYSTGTAARKIKVESGLKGFSFINNYVTAGRIFLDMKNNTNTVIDGNFFNWTAETATAYTYWRPIRMDGVSENFKFTNNKVVQTVADNGGTGFYDLLYFADAKGDLIIEGNDFTMNIYNWLFNVAKATEAIHFVVKNNVTHKVGDAESGAGWAAENLHEDSTAEIIGNTFEGLSGTTFSYKTIKHLTVMYNEFLESVYKPRINPEIGDGLVYADNYVAAESVTAAVASGVTYLTVTKDSDKTQGEVIGLRRAYVGFRDVYEVLNETFSDYAMWMGVADAAQFQADWLAKTGTYNADKELYAAGKQGVIDDELSRFANSSAYGVKYMPLIDAFDAIVNDVNNTQSAWASAWTGLLRIRNYIISGTYRTDAHDQLLVDGLNAGKKADLIYSAALLKKNSSTETKELALECGELNIWSADNNSNYVFLFRGVKSALYWGGIYLKSVGNGLYEVVGTKVSGGAVPVSSCDFSIIASEGNATDYAALTGLNAQVGDIVTFSVDPSTLDFATAFEAPLPTITLYK